MPTTHIAVFHLLPEDGSPFKEFQTEDDIFYENGRLDCGKQDLSWILDLNPGDYVLVTDDGSELKLTVPA